MKLKFLLFAVVLFYALVMGVFWGTWFSQSRTMEVLSAATFLENGRLYIANLAKPMSLLMPATLILTFATLFFVPDKRSAVFFGTLTAGVLMVVTLIITLSVNVPIDNEIKTWTLQTLPTDWRQIRDHWEAFHALRTWISISGFAAFTGGILVSSK